MLPFAFLQIMKLPRAHTVSSHRSRPREIIVLIILDDFTNEVSHTHTHMHTHTHTHVCARMQAHTIFHCHENVKPSEVISACNMAGRI